MKKTTIINKLYVAPACEVFAVIPRMTVCESGTLGNVNEGNAGNDWTD